MNFLDEHDQPLFHFRIVKRTCEGAIIKGLDTKVRQAAPMFPEDGDIFWIRGVFGLTSSQALQ